MLSVNEAIAPCWKTANGWWIAKDQPDGSDRPHARADVIAPIDVPPADNSAMDGYAIRCVDWIDTETAIPLSQRITAGSVPANWPAAAPPGYLPVLSP